MRSYLDDLSEDTGYALRTLRRSPGFTSVVLLILALAIGAVTATFTLIDALMLRTLPVPHPEQLVTIGDPSRTGSLSQGTPRTDLASYPLYADIRKQQRVLSGLYASGRTGRLDAVIERGTGAEGAEAEHPRGRFVSGSYFSVLQVPALAGRTFTADEDQSPGADPVAVISYDYWQRRFGGERSVLGRTISVNNVPLTIVGVTPSGFTGDIVGQPIELWIPLMMQPSILPHNQWLDDRSTCWLQLMGRLAPGVSLAQAATAIGTIERQALLDNATGGQLPAVERTLKIQPVRVESGATGFSYYRGNLAAGLFILMAAVSLVLLVACANVANLMLARAAARGREMSVRLALGAGRLRLLRQLLTESLVLALGGGALGLLVAYWGSAGILRFASPGPRPLPLDVHLNSRILSFSAMVSILTAVLFGLVPALNATRLELASALRTQGRGVTGVSGGWSRLGLGRILVVAQVAVSVSLLVGTGMLVRSMQRMQQADVGVARSELVVASVDAERSGYSGARLISLMRDVSEQVAGVPGVSSVSLSENGLFSGTESGTTLQVEGFIARADTDTIVAYDDVGPRYFGTIGARLLGGRDFEPRDNESGPKVAVVNQTMARFFFPQGDALGHRITMDSSSYEIVGVVGDIQEHSVRGDPVRRLYLPAVQLKSPPGNFKLEIRTAQDPATLVDPIRRALRAVDPSLIVLDVDPLTELIRDSIGGERLVARVVSFFGTLALILAALGLYGVTAYATVRRTSEFGLRMALGAEPGDVARQVLREVMALTTFGMLFGVPAALLGARLIRDQLFGMGALDLPSMGIALVVLVGSAAVAGLLPALRAARVPPMVALRSE